MMSTAIQKLLRHFRPRAQPADATLSTREGLTRFVWRVSGWHQIYIGLLAVLISLLNFVPVELQRRIIDGAIVDRKPSVLINLCLVFLAVLLLQTALKYALLVYQSWVSESAINNAREELAAIAREQPAAASAASSGQTMGVLGTEIEQVGGFIGSSISEAIVNMSFILFLSAYMIYLQPLIAFGCMALLAPQLVLAPYLQPRLNRLVEEQIKLVRTLGDQVSSPDAAVPHRDLGTHATILSLFRNKMIFFALKFGLKGLLNLFSSLAPLAAIFVGGLFVIRGEVTIGALVAFVSGLDKMATPLRDLLNFYRERAQTKVHHAMILSWIATCRSSGSGKTL